ncbi:alkaline phosphatase D family protein [Ramlibacter sp. AW1]|uniref:Alkaline phosphatase D family protein n=1 Tax=Ramlibacter aurantiacus TaxID=2801330 RepID=A0A936ZLJ9_9BURK|nr:alkaline phosphatase D family protein [Ramlibacter aurantiacus]MBL0419470.1 alkaline phosphatase D family protein [Ramlibacter aurantiacus]
MSEPFGHERRQLLRLAAAMAAGSWLPRGAHASPGWGFDPFGIGVASGAPRPDSVVLWTRLLAPGWFDSIGEDPVPVRWEVAHDEAFSRVARRGSTLAMPALAHSVHAEVAGLEPDRWYFYRFIAGGQVSTVGRTRTLPAPGAPVNRLRLAYASCQRWDHGYYGAYRHMREEQPDLVLFLGDYIYEYPTAFGAVRSHPSVTVVRTLAEYRERHALHRSDAALQAMHASCPWLLTWDDHEVQNDYAGLIPGDSRPLGFNQVQEFMVRRNAAYQAWYEHMPVRVSTLSRASSGALEVQVHGRWRFGALADLVLLDGRQWRDVQACRSSHGAGSLIDPGSCAALHDPSRTLLGAAQEQWVDATLADAKGLWTVVGQQGLFGKRDNLPGPGERLYNDGWDGYPAARGRMLDGLRRHAVSNPVFLGGDVHENWVGHIKADYERPDSANVGVEFCGTSITSRARGADRVAQRLAENPHFVFADGYRRGYGVCDFTPGGLTTRLRVVSDVTRPDTGIETLAAFGVRPGEPRIERL